MLRRYAPRAAASAVSRSVEAAFTNVVGARGADGQEAQVVLAPGGVSQALRLSGFATTAMQLDVVIRGRATGGAIVAYARWGRGNGWGAAPLVFSGGVASLPTQPTGLALDVSFRNPDAAATATVWIDDIALQEPNGAVVRALTVAAAPSTESWSSPLAARVTDAQAASCTGMTSDELSERLTLTDFGFALPSAARVVGVQVDVRRREAFIPIEAMRDDAVQLVVGGVARGADRRYLQRWQGDPNIVTDPPYETVTYGGPTDLWALPLTPSIVSSPTFGVSFAVTYDFFAGNGGAEVDSVLVSVTTCE